jgi:hypothetical protein
MLTRQFREYNRLADMPGLRLFIDEARSWFARKTERFDLIEMSVVDTFAATVQGPPRYQKTGSIPLRGGINFSQH